MLLLHAVVAPGTPVPAPLERVDGRRAALCVLSCDEPVMDAHAVREYGARLLALAECCEVLPMRYGTTCTDEEEARSLLAEREDEWGRRLDELRGMVELLVHLRQPDDQPVPEGTSGREYLHRLADRERTRQASIGAVRTRLASLVEGVRELDSHGRLRLACLLPADSVAAAQEALSDCPDVLGVTGPWPPFTFTEERPDVA